MRLLVAGADRVDAGKTTFSVGLLEHVGGVGFKPRAGNDYWFDHDDYRRAVSDGRLYGKDAKRLAAASVSATTPEAINPTHRLWRPAPGGGAGLVGPSDREFVLDRVGDRYVVNAAAEVPALARDTLSLGDAIPVTSLSEFNAVMEDHHLAALDALEREIGDRDRVVVESYGDVARPLRDLAYDAVAVVEPERARIYDGDRYATACEVTRRSPYDGQLERRVSDVVEHLNPVATTTLPALGDDARADPTAIADAYEVAYDALVAAALDR